MGNEKIMNSEKQIKELAKNLFANIEFEQKPEGLFDPLRYTIAIGGKRIRPILCLTAYYVFKKHLLAEAVSSTEHKSVEGQKSNSEEQLWTKEILSPTEGIEVFHSFTLLHDDIMDKSPFRRGEDTVWKKWDEDTAILSGDVMCIDSYRRIAEAPVEVLKSVLDLFTKTATEVCQGQQYDMEFESRDKVSMEEYLKMIGLKTAVLIACSAKMGALIAGANEESCENIYNFAHKIGIAFQIADDYLDIYGNKEVFGKPIGGDIINAKKSWMLIKAYQLAAESAESSMLSKLEQAMAMPIETQEQKDAKILAVKEIYDKVDVAGAAKVEVRKLNKEAVDYLEKLPIDQEGKDMLKNLAINLIGRSS